MAWTSAHCTFVVEKVFKTGESVIATHTVFLAHVVLRGNDAFTDRKSILWLVDNFMSTGSALKIKQHGRPRSSPNLKKTFRI